MYICIYNISISLFATLGSEPSAKSNKIQHQDKIQHLFMIKKQKQPPTEKRYKRTLP